MRRIICRSCGKRVPKNLCIGAVCDDCISASHEILESLFGYDPFDFPDTAKIEGSREAYPNTKEEK